MLFNNTFIFYWHCGCCGFVLICYFIVHFSNWVSGACNLVKQMCTNCNTDAHPCDRPFLQKTQENCYNVVDGATNIMTEYKVLTSVCKTVSCYHTNIVYDTDHVITWMTSCVSGTPLFIHVIIIPLHNIY